MTAKNIVLIDNYDSFTYNLVDELRAMGSRLTVFRNSVDTKHVLRTMHSFGENTLLMLSPGPGSPSDAGNMLSLLSSVKGLFPVIGVCLGYQGIVQLYGGVIDRAPEVFHGKSSAVAHHGDKMFESLPNPLKVARYHSLMAAQIPEQLQIIASYEGIPMAVINQVDRMLGFQFHPESILTAQGKQLLQQSIQFLTYGGHL
ncbi:MAG: aminodeoxychorismate/anthranilate synthase component II [Oligoflexales bacterium]|nr:aminodeoxychorismate/anthranilate synthase component II [Oligoflexales bacterium]